MLQIDLNTKIIQSSAQIWILHSGIGRKYAKVFNENSVVFLDLPRLDIKDTDNLNTPLLRQKIERSRAWKKYALDAHGLIAMGEPSPPPPSWDINDYAGPTRDNSLTTDQTSVAAIYFTAKKGDLIVVPEGRGQFGSVRFAEILDDFDVDFLFYLNYFVEYPVNARRVVWLDPRVKRRDLPEKLAKQVENRRAATELDRAEYGNDVYSLAYANFSTDSLSKATIFGPLYTSKDPRDLVPAINLISWLVLVYPILASTSPDQINAISVADRISREFDRYLIKDFTVKFTSPGEFNILAKDRWLAAFVAAAVPVLLLQSDSKQSIGSVKIINESQVETSQKPNLSSDSPPSIALHALVKSLSPQQRNALNKLSGEARQKIGLRTSAKARIVIDSTDSELSQ